MSIDQRNPATAFVFALAVLLPLAFAKPAVGQVGDNGIPLGTGGCQKLVWDSLAECDCNGAGCCDNTACDCGFSGSTCGCIGTVAPRQSAAGRGRSAPPTCGLSGALAYLGLQLLHSPARRLLNAAGAVRGAYVDWVIKGGPADHAGLRQGDLIVEFAGEPIASADALDAALSQSSGAPGQPLDMVFLRLRTRQSATIAPADPADLFPRMRVPFVAKVLEERDWTQNGLSGHESGQVTIYRDRLGRQASDELIPHAGGAAIREVRIFDPVKGVNIFFNSSSTTALVIDSRRPPSRVAKPQPKILRWAEYPSEYLGTRVIQGLKCEGYRTERVLENAADLGIVTSAPVTQTSERWFTDLTSTPALEIDESPFVGRSESRIVEVRQGSDPDAAVFRVPAGYNVEERGYPGSALGTQVAGVSRTVSQRVSEKPKDQ